MRENRRQPPSWAQSIGGYATRGDHGQNNVVLLFVEFQDELDTGKFVRGAKVDGRGGANEVHGFQADASPGSNVLEVKTGFFLLKQYSHTLLSFCTDCSRDRLDWRA